jgi:DNA-binding IclR family transcriptional regulator
MSLQPIRNAVEMTTQPKLSRLLALLIEHGGLTVSAVAPLLNLPPFMVRRFADRLLQLGYATHAEGKYYATMAGREIYAVIHPGRLLP